MGSFFSLSHSNPYRIYHSLAFEEAISRHFVSFGYTGGIRFWSSRSCLVLGISENPLVNLKPSVWESFLQKQDLRKKNRNQTEDATPDIARRASGGGTVVQTSSENLNFSFFANLEERKDLYSVQNSYEVFLGLVVRAMANQGIESRWKGKSDLVLESRNQSLKFSGNAQFRKKNCIVHHGTLILSQDLIHKAEDFLQHPPEEPDYRQKRSHKQFLTPLPVSFSRLQFEKDLTQIWREFLGFQEGKVQNNKLEGSFWKSVLRSKQELLSKYTSLGFIQNKELP